MDTSWALVITSAFWPFVVVVVVMTILLTQRKAVSTMISRVKGIEAGPARIDIHEAEAIVESNERLEKASADVAQQQTEEERRASIEALIREAADWGWTRGHLGSPVRPRPEIQWNEESGLPEIQDADAETLYLQLPTGSGKTESALRLAAALHDLRKRHNAFFLPVRFPHGDDDDPPAGVPAKT